MLTVALVFAGLAAALHVYIFVMESLRWEHPATRKAFGTTAEQAAATAPMAFNQGFYNLFLAISTALGIVLIDANRDAGIALVLCGIGSMFAAALVLVAHDRGMARAAAIQGTLPALGLLGLLIWSL